MSRLAFCATRNVTDKSVDGLLKAAVEPVFCDSVDQAADHSATRRTVLYDVRTLS